MMHKDIKNYILEKVKRKGSCSIRGLGTFTIKPSKKGMTYTKYGVLPRKYDKRIVFKSSEVFKEQINE